MTDVAAVLAAAQRPELPVEVYLGPPDLPHERLRLDRLKKRTEEQQAELDDLIQQVRASTLTTRVRAIPHRKWAEIVVQHPPRDDVPEDKKAGVNTLSFWRAVVPLCLPDLTSEQYERLDEVISEGDWRKVCGVVETVNMGQTIIPKSPAASPTSPNSDGT